MRSAAPAGTDPPRTGNGRSSPRGERGDRSVRNARMKPVHPPRLRNMCLPASEEGGLYRFIPPRERRCLFLRFVRRSRFSSFRPSPASCRCIHAFRRKVDLVHELELVRLGVSPRWGEKRGCGARHGGRSGCIPARGEHGAKADAGAIPCLDHPRASGTWMVRHSAENTGDGSSQRAGSAGPHPLVGAF